MLISKLLQVVIGWFSGRQVEQAPASSKRKPTRRASNDGQKRTSASRNKTSSSPAVISDVPLLFTDLPISITPAIRKQMRADALRYLPEGTQPSVAQWKMVFSTTISTCVVAGAGSGKSSSLALRVLLLHHYLKIPLADISVVTFTRASRADFAERLVDLCGRWQVALSLPQALERVTTFHATVLGWARTMPGFSRLQAFESLGAANEGGTPLQLQINATQREQLNRCYHRLMAEDPAFAQSIQSLRLQADALPKRSPSHPDVQKRLAALIPASQRDDELCTLIEAHWQQAGQWPIAGIEPTSQPHVIEGQVFRCHGYHAHAGAWVMLGAEPGLGDRKRPGARLSARAEWAVKRTLFQAFFDKPLIWLENFEHSTGAFNQSVQGAGFDYRLTGEYSSLPLLDAFAAMAGFIENLGLEVPAAAASLHDGEDALFFNALGTYWRALEKQLLASTPPVLTYNRMFAIFADATGSALSRLPADKLQGIRHLLVDEFQDVSPQIATWLNAGLAERLRRDGASSATLMCVGDDWQSIYGWRGSSPRFFIEFAKAFPAPTYRRLMLKDNFRSTQQIIDAAELIVKDVPSIAGKKAAATNLADAKRGNLSLQWTDPYEIAATLEAALNKGQSVLLLHRQGKDDPRRLPPVADLLKAQHLCEPEARQVRSMTIHAAKGLQAEVVILLGDCEARLQSPSRNRLYALAGLADQQDPNAYDKAQADEALRLAYVAITRAAREVYWFIDRPKAGREGEGASARVTTTAGVFLDKRC